MFRRDLATRSLVAILIASMSLQMTVPAYAAPVGEVAHEADSEEIVEDTEESTEEASEEESDGGG